jgi:hypothetical protein
LKYIVGGKKRFATLPEALAYANAIHLNVSGLLPNTVPQRGFCGYALL